MAVPLICCDEVYENLDPKYPLRRKYALAGDPFSVEPVEPYAHFKKLGGGCLNCGALIDDNCIIGLVYPVHKIYDSMYLWNPNKPDALLITFKKSPKGTEEVSWAYVQPLMLRPQESPDVQDLPLLGAVPSTNEKGFY